jgi:hypothetical protein
MLVGFMHPDDDPRVGAGWPPDLWDPLFTLDISAEAQPVDANIDEGGNLFFQEDSYTLALHYQDELDEIEIEGAGLWCRSRVYTPQTGWVDRDPREFNLLQSLQNFSNLDDNGDLVPDGLTGRLEGGSNEWGFSFFVTLEGSGDFIEGHYRIDLCYGNCGARDVGEYVGGGYDGYDYWRILNAPIAVYRQDLNPRWKNKWNDKTLCGQYVGSELDLIHRRGAYEIIAKKAGG